MIHVRWVRAMKRLERVGIPVYGDRLQSGLDLVANWSRRHTEYRQEGTIPMSRKLSVPSFLRFLTWYMGEEVVLVKED